MKKPRSKKCALVKLNRDTLAKAIGVARINGSQIIDFNILCEALGLDDAV